MAGEFVSIERLTEIHLGDVETIEAIEAIGREGFDDGEFSIRSEITRTWARLWVARLATPTPDAPIGAPVGFLVGWHVADELHVLNVATASAMRRRGIARALMDESLRYAAEHHLRIILLEVRRSNRAAIKLYRGLGFTALNVRVGYYDDNEDAIEMILSLEPSTGAIRPGRDEVCIDD